MNRGMKHHYLERIENLRLAIRQLARELDVNLGAEHDHLAQAKAMEAHEHASAGLVGLARIVRETVTTPAYFTDAVEPVTGEVESGTYPQARRAPWPTRHDEPEAEQRVPDAVEVEEVAPCSS